MKKFVMTILFSLAGSIAVAQDNVGTESAFSFGVGARDLALGGSFLANPSDLSAVFWNPSSLASVSRPGLTGFHTQLFESGMSYQYFGGVVPTMTLGTFALGISRIGVNDIDARDINNQSLGLFDDSRMSYRVGYGKSFQNISVGASLHLEHQSIYNYSSTSSVGFDLAVSRNLLTSNQTIPEISFAAIGKNLLKPSHQFINEKVSFPNSFEGGTTIHLEPWQQHDISAAVSLAVAKVSGIDPTFRTGIEVMFASHLAARAGYRDGSWSAGVGLQWSGISFDYAYLDQELDALHLLSLSIAIGPSKTERLEKKRFQQALQSAKTFETELVAKQKRTIDSLLYVSDSAFESRNLQLAENCLDRAVFLTAVSGKDTTDISERRRTILTNIALKNRLARLIALEDSTRNAIDKRDWQSANYYANLVLKDSAQHKEAITWKKLADTEIAKLTSKEQLIKATLLKADSLLKAGNNSEAYATLLRTQSLVHENEQLKKLIDNLAEKLLREKAEQALSSKSFELTQLYIDSAKTLYGERTWIKDLSKNLSSAKNKVQKNITIVSASQPAVLTEELTQEVEKIYKEAVNLFATGDLEKSILRWENVEAIAPNYKDVHKRLFTAYKFVGIEAYGKNKLESAVSAWKSALIYAPKNKEVSNYLSRAETELNRRKVIRSELQ